MTSKFFLVITTLTVISCLAKSTVTNAPKKSQPQNLTMYQLPSTEAAKVGQLNPSKTINILNSGWVYVFDSQSNKAGWVKSEALKQAMGGYHYSTRLISRPNGHGQNFYQTVTYTMEPKMTTKQAKAFWRREKAREQKLLTEFHRSIDAIHQMSRAMFDWAEEDNNIDKNKPSQ